MVYEGRRSRGSYSGRRQAKSKRGGGGFFALCLWVLFIALAVRVMFPDTAESIKAKAMEVIGADYGKAVRVFGEELGGGAGIVDAAKTAFAQAFTPEGEDVQVFGGEDSGDGGALPAAGDEGGAPATAGDNGETLPASATLPEGEDKSDAVAVFKAEQAKITDLAAPANVTYEKPELDISLSPPATGTVTSGFGYRAHPSDGQIRFHYGVDIGAEAGSDVTSCADGTVTAVGDSTSYGLYVILSHDGGAESIYAHMSEVAVSDGQTVKAGERLGAVGDTGNATSACLHLELLIDGDYVNPEYYLTLR